jgi:hypothetical protein
VTFIAGVSTADYSIPTGSITFFDGTTALGTVTLDASGGATITTSALALGDHDITAIYSGAPTYAGSSAFMTQTIALDRTGMFVSADVNQSQPGQEVTFTATVYTDLNDGTPIGSVTFFNGTTALGSASLDATGSASLTTSFAAAGNYTIVAIYSGNEWYAGSSARTEQTVGQSPLASTATELITSASPSLPGQAVTFTATVEGLGGGGVTPTGSVKFLDGTTLLGMETLDANGSATCTTSTLALGDHNITAIYSGDDTYFGSTYTIVQPVERGETSTSLTSSALASLPEQAVTFTATVSAMAGGTPTGSVTFYDGTNVLGTVTLDTNGNATFTTSGLWLGDHNITAIYSGDAIFATSSFSLRQSVLKFDTTTTLTASANPSPLGQPVTLTATVAADIGTPTGTVNFYDGATLLGTGTLSLVNGQMQATFTTAALGYGGHTIVAIYSGDSTFADSGAWLEEGVI